jgi:hypothetical protein
MTYPPYLSATDLTTYLHRSRGHVYRRAGTSYLLPAPVVPAPRPRWSLTDLDTYFDGTPNPDVGCVVPADSLASRELALGVYACPTDSGYHIGLERPSLLGLYEAGMISVYKVKRIETSSAVGPQSAQASSSLISRIRSDRKSHGETWQNLTVFHLAADPVGTFEVDRDRKYQQGRVMPSADIRAALS